jgi:hypothetical protein
MIPTHRLFGFAVFYGGFPHSKKEPVEPRQARKFIFFPDIL